MAERLPPSAPPPGPPTGPPGLPPTDAPPGPPGIPGASGPPGLPPGLDFQDPAIASAQVKSPPAPPGMKGGPPPGIATGPPGIGSAPPGMGKGGKDPYLMQSPGARGPPGLGPGAAPPQSASAPRPPGLEMSPGPYGPGGKGAGKGPPGVMQTPVQMGPNQPQVLPMKLPTPHIALDPLVRAGTGQGLGGFVVEPPRLTMPLTSVRDDGETVDILPTNLVEFVDKMVVIQINDGRTVMGMLRSFDNFANLVLEHAVERHFVDHFYADLYLGCMLIRGENVVMVADVNDQATMNLTKVKLHELLDKEDQLLRATDGPKLNWDFLDIED